MRRAYEAVWRRVAALGAVTPAGPGAEVLAALDRGDAVADLGHGRAPVDGLAARFRRVVPVDVPGALVAAGPGVHPVAADLEGGLPFTDGALDAVVARDVIEHLFDAGAFLVEVARTLAPGGRLVLETVNAAHLSNVAALLRGDVPATVDASAWLSGLPAPHHGHVNPLTARVLAELLAAAGFEQVVVTGYGRSGGRLAGWLPEALSARFLARGLRASARRGRAPLPVPASSVSAVIVSHESRADVETCLAALARADLGIPVVERIVVDNDSADGTVAAVRRDHPDVHVLARRTNDGFAAAVNAGVERARCRHVLVLNADVVLTPGSLAALAAPFAADPRVLATGGLLVAADGAPGLSWVHFPGPRVLLAWFAGRRGWTRLAGRLTPPPRAGRGGPLGACLLVDRLAFRELGGLDERFFLYAEEIDLYARAARRGRRVVRVPAVVACHRGGGATRRDPVRASASWIASHRALLAKHGRPLTGALFVALTALDRWLSSRPVVGERP